MRAPAPAALFAALAAVALAPAAARAADPAPRKVFPESAPFPPPREPKTRPPILCDATALPPSDAEAAAPGSYDRATLAQWQAVYAQCPTAANLYQLATASEVVGRREASIILLEQSLDLHQRYLASDPPPSSAIRAAIEGRMEAVRGAIRGRRLRTYLEQARRQQQAGQWQDAVASYDRYLAEAGDDPERARVQAARATAQSEGERAATETRRDRARRAGKALLGIGGVLIAGGIIGLGVAQVSADDASHTTDPSQRDSLDRRTGTARLLGYTGLVGGVLSMAVGAIALVNARQAPEERRAPALDLPEQVTLWIAPAVTPTSGLLAAGGTF